MEASPPLGIRTASEGMCSNESGIDKSRTFMGVPYTGPMVRCGSVSASSLLGVILALPPVAAAQDPGAFDQALAEAARGDDADGYRAEFVTLVRAAEQLAGDRRVSQLR